MNEEEFDGSDIPMGIAPGACWDELQTDVGENGEC